MIYETEIKLKNTIIQIEFDSETEEFSYAIKERKQANAKTESKEKNESGKSESGKSESGKSESESRRSEPETEFDKL